MAVGVRPQGPVAFQLGSESWEQQKSWGPAGTLLFSHSHSLVRWEPGASEQRQGRCCVVGKGRGDRIRDHEGSQEGI